MALQQAAVPGIRVMGSFLGRSSSVLGQTLAGSQSRAGSSGINGSIEQVESHLAQVAAFDNKEDKAAQPSFKAPTFAAAGLGGAQLAGRNPLLLGKRIGSPSSMPWAAQQTMAMSTAREVRTGAAFNSLLVTVYRFWRSQAPMEKPAAPVNDRMLPAVIEANSQKAAVGTWATTLFCTILASNLLGLVPFNEAPTSGLGFATGLGVSVWATATALGLYKLGFAFPGHFIPGGTPWPMAFIFVPLETISYTFRAVSLGVRLWVNMLAGHTLLHILTGMALALPFSLSFFAMVPATFAVATLLSALVGLEYLVAVLQSGVFSILSTVYVGEFNSVKFAGPLAKIVKKI